MVKEHRVVRVVLAGQRIGHSKRREAKSMVYTEEAMQQKKQKQVNLSMDEVTPSTKLLEKRRQMFEVQECLEHERNRYEKEETKFKEREEGIKRKDSELQERLIRFSKFLQENDLKKARAERKASNEMRLTKQKEAQIAQDKAALEAKHLEKSEKASVLDRNLRYTRFLEQALEESDEFHEINDLVNRFETLKATNTQLRNHAQRCEQEYERKRSELNEYVKQKTNQILSLTNEVNRLKKQLEACKSNAQDLAEKRDNDLRLSSEKTKDHGQVTMTTDNLFHRCITKSKVRGHYQQRQHTEQLKTICEFMLDLKAIKDLYDQQGAANFQPEQVRSITNE